MGDIIVRRTLGVLNVDGSPVEVFHISVVSSERRYLIKLVFGNSHPVARVINMHRYLKSIHVLFIVGWHLAIGPELARSQVIKSDLNFVICNDSYIPHSSLPKRCLRTLTLTHLRR